jgi:hypothetical protein
MVEGTTVDVKFSHRPRQEIGGDLIGAHLLTMGNSG